MLISHTHRFIFIHVDKAAGTSLQAALQPHAEPVADSRLRKRLAKLGPLCRIGGIFRTVQFGEHVGASTVKRCLPPERYDSYFKFAFVRNPWDRLVSRYHYLANTVSHRHNPTVKAMADFSEYARWEMARANALIHQHNYLCDNEGELIVDFVGRFESLHEDFAKISERLELTASLPHLNSTGRNSYRDYYDASLRDEVGRFFAKDIELFGYRFDAPREGEGGDSRRGKSHSESERHDAPHPPSP